MINWWTLQRKCVMERKISVSKEMYNNIKTSVKIDGEQLKELEVKIVVHQGLVLSLLLFAVVIDKVMRDMKKLMRRNFSMMIIWCYFEIARKKQK